MISTRGRYALRVMVDLAEHVGTAYVPLGEIAKRQQISQKYLENIVKSLVKAGLLDALRGKGGGYRLNRPPEDYTVGEILRNTEGPFLPVPCLEPDAEPCPQASNCRQKEMWQEYYRLSNEFLDTHTLKDLANTGKPGDDYVI